MRQSLSFDINSCMILTFLLPEVSLSSVSMPPLNDTGDRVPSTDSSLISLKGEAGPELVTEECRGVVEDTGDMLRLIAASLGPPPSDPVLSVRDGGLWAGPPSEDCLFMRSVSRLLLLNFTPEFPLEAEKEKIQILKTVLYVEWSMKDMLMLTI